MSLTSTNIFLVMSFVLLGLKWFGTGYLGRVVGQLIFVLPLSLFLYLSTLAIVYRSSPVPRERIKEGNRSVHTALMP